MSATRRLVTVLAVLAALLAPAGAAAGAEDRPADPAVQQLADRATAYLGSLGLAVEPREVWISDGHAHRVSTAVTFAWVNLAEPRIYLTEWTHQRLLEAASGAYRPSAVGTLAHEVAHRRDSLEATAWMADPEELRTWEEGIADAVASDVSPGMARALGLRRFRAPRQPHYGEETQAVRQLCKLRTGRGWRTPAARRCRWNLQAMPMPERHRIIAEVNAGLPAPAGAPAADLPPSPDHPQP